MFNGPKMCKNISENIKRIFYMKSGKKYYASEKEVAKFAQTGMFHKTN